MRKYGRETSHSFLIDAPTGNLQASRCCFSEEEAKPHLHNQEVWSRALSPLARSITTARERSPSDPGCLVLRYVSVVWYFCVKGRFRAPQHDIKARGGGVLATLFGSDRYVCMLK